MFHDLGPWLDPVSRVTISHWSLRIPNETNLVVTNDTQDGGTYSPENAPYKQKLPTKTFPLLAPWWFHSIVVKIARNLHSNILFCPEKKHLVHPKRKRHRRGWLVFASAKVRDDTRRVDGFDLGKKRCGRSHGAMLRSWSDVFSLFRLFVQKIYIYVYFSSLYIYIYIYREYM